MKIKRYQDFISEDAVSTASSVGGMGNVVAAQPGVLSGTTGTTGSGDVSTYLYKDKKRKKGDVAEVTDLRDLEPAKGVTKVDESRTEVIDALIKRGYTKRESEELIFKHVDIYEICDDDSMEPNEIAKKIEEEETGILDDDVLIESKVTPEGFEEGKPSSNEPGNYYVNGQKTLLFWDGKTWHKATKDFEGGYNWHSDLGRQPNVTCYKFVNHVNILQEKSR